MHFSVLYRSMKFWFSYSLIFRYYILFALLPEKLKLTYSLEKCNAFWRKKVVKEFFSSTWKQDFTLRRSMKILTTETSNETYSKLQKYKLKFSFLFIFKKSSWKKIYVYIYIWIILDYNDLSKHLCRFQLTWNIS